MTYDAGFVHGLVSRRIERLGKSGYSIDRHLSGRDLLAVSLHRAACLLRGFLVKWRFRGCGTGFFLGRNVRIVSPRRIRMGRAVTFEDGVEINALSRDGVVLGNNVTIKKNATIECTGVLRELGQGLEIGDNVGITQNCFIQVRGRVRIGSNVMFGPGAMVFSENHGTNGTGVPMIRQKTARRGVTVEDDVWIGAGAMILDGVTVGTGSVVAAGSVVTRSVEAHSVVAGVPARVIGRRDA